MLRTGCWLSLDHRAFRTSTREEGRQAPARYWGVQHEVGNPGVGAPQVRYQRVGAPQVRYQGVGGTLGSDTRERGAPRGRKLAAWIKLQVLSFGYRTASVLF